MNVLLIPGGYATIVQYGSTMVDIGYQGYFSGKNFWENLQRWHSCCHFTNCSIPATGAPWGLSLPSLPLSCFS